MRFLINYVQVTKCPPDTKYKQNPNQATLITVAILITVRRVKGTPHDTLWRKYKEA